MSSKPNRRDFHTTLLGAAGLTLFDLPGQAAAVQEGELLYNGIRLPTPFPPRIKDVPADPVVPHYLTNKGLPAVIPIDVGRQLFVDDFLIDRTTLTRTHHRPTYAKSPVLTGGMVFSDGVFYDPQDRIFKMWYHTKGGTGYATSKDGLKWDKPKLDVVKGTNIVQTSPRDSATVWIDLLEKDPKKRYKMFRSASRPELKSWCLWVHYSADGIHWTSEKQPTGACGDRTTVFFNPFRGVWVYSLRHGWGQPRRRRYWETRGDVVQAAQWGANSAPAMWCGSDNLDPPRADYKVTPQLYNLDCAAYESIMVGLFTIWRGQFPGREKPNEVCVGYSRDGWSWTRPDRRGFCPVSENKGDWNYANVQSAGGGFLVVGDQLYFYCSGRGTGHVTALATLRRDGFSSMGAGKDEGTLTTRPIRFRGSHCFVNVDAPKGELRVEVLDQGGKVIAPFTRANCTPISADRTAQQVQWNGAADLAKLAGQTVRFRFHLTSGKLYAFWVSPEANGASHGYVAAGGPGFTGLTDTVGSARGR